MKKVQIQVTITASKSYWSVSYDPFVNGQFSFCVLINEKRAAFHTKSIGRQ